jgi:hypothetical protein
MPGSSFLPKLCFALAAVLGLALGLTTYTFPIIGRIEDKAVTSLLHQALQDTVTPLPSPPAELGVAPVATPTPDPFGERFATDTTVPAAAQPAAWAARAASLDPGALRDWLNQAGLFTGATEADTVRTTLWRLTLHRGCPLLSRLRTVSTLSTDRLVEISSDCPPGASAPNPVGPR